jgi:hypothetical protein
MKRKPKRKTVLKGGEKVSDDQACRHRVGGPEHLIVDTTR